MCTKWGFPCKMRSPTFITGNHKLHHHMFQVGHKMKNTAKLLNMYKNC